MMKWVIFILAFCSATFARADGSIYLPNIPGYATGTVSGSHNAIDVNVSAGTVTATNPSVGSTGSSVPASATFMGVKDGSGNLLGLSLGQAIKSASLPVTLASDQGALSVSQSGTWNINNISGTVSLPTGASTSALQTTGNASLASIVSVLPAALGQTTMSASLPVTLASNQSALPSISDNTASGTIAATSQTITLTTNGAATTAIQLTGTWSGAVNFTASVDGTNFFSLICTTVNGSNVGNATANGHWQCPTAGYAKIQLIGSAWVSGTATGTMISSIGASLVYTQNFSSGNFLAQVSPSNTANTTPWLFTVNQGGHSALVSAAGALTVDGSAVTQPVSAASLPLPTGASTSALQTTANTTLSAISAQLPATLGQKTMSESLPVTMASDQVAAKTYQNSAGSFVLNASLTTVVSEACPSGGVGFILEASSANTANIRWALGATATTSSGMRLEPGRDTVFVPVCATISIVSESGTQEYELTWVKQ